MDPDKRKYRRLKRDVKKAGQRKRRRQLEHDLQANPEDAHHGEFAFGKDSSRGLNGLDQDATRRRRRGPEEEGPSPEE